MNHGGVPSEIGAISLEPPPLSRTLLISAALFTLCVGAYFISPVHEVTDSDYSMLLSENIWRFGSLALDRYFQHPERHWPPHHIPAPHTPAKISYHVYVYAGHIYYFYPLGSSVLSVPLVATENMLGLRASDPVAGYSRAREQALERINAALVTALTVVLLFAVARQVLDDRRAAALALVAAFGTGLFSTASRVMWTHTWGVCLLSAALLLLVRGAKGKALRPVLLGTLLSWLYFTRPMFSIAIAGVTIYVLLVHRSSFVPYALTGAAWLACFIPVSLATSGHVLPKYFRETKTFSLYGFPEGFAGVLVSPSRGLLVYSPAILVIVWLVIRGRGKLARPGLALLAAAVACGHLIVLGLYPKWSGGASYGARYATDIVPWLFLLAVLGWLAAIDARSHSFLARATAALLIVASVFVQAPGALSHSAWLWNADPSPEHLWDWTDPQFLHWKHPDIRRTGPSQVTGRALAENGAPPPVPLVRQLW